MSYVTLELTALPPEYVDDQIAAVKALAEADPNIQITIEFTGLEFLSLFEASAATVDKPKPAAKSKPVKVVEEVEEDEEDDAGDDDEPSKSTRFRRTKEEKAADLSVEQAKALRKSKLSIEEFLAKQDGGDDEEDDDTASATDEDDTEEDEDDADVEVDEDEGDEEEASEEEDEPTVTPAQVVDLAKKAVGYPGLTSDERRPHLSRILKKLKVDRFSNIPSDQLEEGAAELNAVLKKFKKLVEDKKS